MLKKKFHNFDKLTDAINLKFNYFNIYNLDKHKLDFFFRQKIIDDIGIMNLSNKLCSSEKIICALKFLINLKKRVIKLIFFFKISICNQYIKKNIYF